jgi:hypothetical protein
MERGENSLSKSILIRKSDIFQKWLEKNLQKKL